mgnify:FL=1
MKKLLIILSVLVFLMLPFTAYAAIIPEDNLIGETVLIEPDGNFIKDNIKNGNPYDTGPEETAQILSLDRDGYVKKFTLPFLYLICAGFAVYGTGSAISAIISKKKKV